MKLNVKISESIIERLKKVTNSCCGKLYGIIEKNDLAVTILQRDNGNDFNCINSFPSGIKQCGIFFVATDDKIPDIQTVPRSILLTYMSRINKFSLYHEDNGKWVNSDYQIVHEHEVNSTFLYIRVKGEIILKSEFAQSAVKEAFQNIQKCLSPESVFSFSKSNIFLLENESLGIENSMRISEFWDETNGINEENNRKKHKNITVKPRVLEFRFLQALTKNNVKGKVEEHAPIGILNKNPSTVVDTLLELDALSMIHEQTQVCQLHEILRNSIERILKCFEENILNSLESKEYAKSLAFKIYHYYPENVKHFMTLLYNHNQDEKLLRNERQKLHEQLLLDSSMPCFRKANQYSFDRKLNSPLINPHQGVKNTDNGGNIFLVKGKYEYYHYCQNKMDDDGWGCAYRSLQTLASWFKMQGHTDREVPTFKEIQQCLVDIKDKPTSFVGSRQWIGSTEVNFVLNTLFSIDNKILYVSSGDDMGSNGPELVNHFKNHGSPIMIGGGVLAHTIIGVDYNQETGNIKFLILDPHYTGSEDINVIQNKGWCGWKGVDFWKKTAYYNMCMPLVPREI